MKSKCTFKLLFVLFYMFLWQGTSVFGQDIEYPSHIEICKFGWNKIYLEDPSGLPALPQMSFFNESYGGFSKDEYYEYPYFYFFLDSNQPIPPSGTFEIGSSGGTGAVSTGTFTSKTCHDYIRFVRENTCGIFIIFKPTDPVPVHNGESNYQVCVGDTTPMFISPNTYTTTTLANQPFSIDRLKISNGYVIDVDDYTFKVVWTSEGFDLLELTTTDECGFSLVTFQGINVHESNPLQIKAEGGVSELSVCVGETVFLDSDIGPTKYPVWTISDGRILRGKSIEVNFDVPGQYTVSLDDEDECNCSMKDEIIVHVVAGESPDITCIGTICENTSVIYYSEDLCDSYYWTISGDGIITDGGGETDYFIAIDWGQGSEGLVELSTPGCYASPCRESVEVTIPILGPTAEIEGPDIVCYLDSDTYTIPLYAGTSYRWSLMEPESMNPLYHYSYQGDNKCTVDWPDVTYYDEVLIIVEYENCTLGCSGRAEKLVQILQPVSLSADGFYGCLNDAFTVEEQNGELLNFEIVSPSGAVTNYNGVSTFTFFGTENGNYQLTAINPTNSTCNSEGTMEFTVNLPPPIPEGIVQQGLICTGVNTSFEIANLPSGFGVSWTVFDGDASLPTYTINGKTLNHLWVSAGPCKIEAQLIDLQSGCIGESIVELYDSSAEVMGEDRICISNEAIYSIPNINNVSVAWSIIPDNAGVVLQKSNKSIEIYWGAVGNHVVKATICGQEVEYNVEVVSYELDLMYPDSVCINGTGDVYVVAPSGSTIDYFNENDVFIGTGTSISLGKGEYSVVVNTPDQCIDGGEFSIYEFEEYEVFIDVDGPLAFCQPHPPITFTAITPPGAHSHAWYRNNVLVSNTASSYSTDEFGYYYVIVTNEFGCEAQSSTIVLSQCCGDSFYDCDANALVINTTDIDCFEKEFEATNIIDSDMLTWDFDDPASGSNYAEGTNVSHVFSGVGIYNIIATGNDGCVSGTEAICGSEDDIICCEAGQTTVIIYTKADFEVEEACPMQTIELTNLTDKINGYTGETYSWDFGDPTSATNLSNDVNPIHSYDNPGTYTITLIVTDHLGCASISEQQIIVRPNPTAVLEAPELGCKGFDVSFNASTSMSTLSFRWDFGDPNSGYYNTSKLQSPTHIFVDEGTYTITLVVESEIGCISTFTETIDIEYETDLGSISSSSDFLICPGANTTLTAPIGVDYLWSTGETTQSITVNQSGNYDVMVTTNAGCSFVPGSAIVNEVDLTSLRIYGATRDDAEGATIHYESMTVCKGEHFIIESESYPNVKFTWDLDNSVGPTLNYYENGLAYLDVGTYTMSAVAVDTILDCTVDLSPFVVHIIELPEAPVIESTTPNICTDGTATLYVVDPIPGYIYVWSNGLVGTSINPIDYGQKNVVAYSPSGCPSARSNNLIVRNRSVVPPWVGGCHEVCFPFTVCTRLYTSYDYQLIKNETEITVVDNTVGEIIIDGPGDYELIATNSSGCSAKSEMLTLNTMPEQQSLSGIVYFDENSSGVFDGVDTLLANIPVIICNGNTPIDTSFTNANGEYSFENLHYANLTAKIDLSSTPYSGGGGLDTLLIYEGCIEAKEVNFPVDSECEGLITDEVYFVCEGLTVEIDGEEFAAGYQDTVIYALEGICDSIVYISVEEYQVPDVVLEITNACSNAPSGMLLIHMNTMDSLLFRMDENDAWLSDSIFGDLGVGSYELEILSPQGCLFIKEFNLEQVASPELNLEVLSTCAGEENGSLLIDVLSGTDLTFSLDGGTTFTDQIEYENLSPGSYVLDVVDGSMCTYQRMFTIEVYPEPEYSIETNSSCEIGGTGSLLIDATTENLLFSIDVTNNWNNLEFYKDLSVGSHTLYIQTVDGCIDSIDFIIETVFPPIYAANIKASCEGQNNGEIIFSFDDPVLTALNNGDFTNQMSYDGLIPGEHILYYMTEEGCIFEFLFEILESEEPEVEIETEASCFAMGNGRLTLTLEDPDVEVRIISTEGNELSADANLLPGNYTVFVRTNTICEYGYPFEIVEQEELYLASIMENTCIGAEEGKIVIEDKNAHSLVSLNNGPFEDTDVFENLPAGLYILTLQDSSLCTADYEVEIVSFDELTVDLPVETNECFGEPILLRPDVISYYGELSYEWNDGSTADEKWVNQSEDVQLIVSDFCSSKTFNFQVEVSSVFSEDLVYLPNIFSPNSDDVNDCFQTVLDPSVSLLSYNQIIFDRWGNKMFESNAIENCWDGIVNGREVVPGVYVYITKISANQCNGIKSIEKVGDVTVVR
ncbi:MAG: PKD domain-containing protein [Saprospiraceae bacterium]|nr:PKD domain-containing protein [Saprospiraceae bacterium]